MDDAQVNSDSPIILYGSPLCGMVPGVRKALNRASISYEYVDIMRSSQAREQVREINNGYESVPTLVFGDGSTLTEPTIRELETQLEALGYTVRPASWLDQGQIILENPVARLTALLLIVFGFAGASAWAVTVGLVILVLGFLLPLLRGK